MVTGRFAPSPTGALHIGNLRTALLAWLFARSERGRFLVRMEDLDAVVSRREFEEWQLSDLLAIGLDWDGAVVRQSERRALYEDALTTLIDAGLTYPCYCTRKEILASASAPHGDVAAYPGTCRSLSTIQQRRLEQGGRRPALRLRSDGSVITVKDLRCGPVVAVLDDVVLRRNDGVPSYNLAVVVDDGAQGVNQVVRGDDLLSSTPRQVGLARLLGIAPPRYAHVPLVLGPSGQRLAKRDGAVTLADQLAGGVGPERVLARLGASVGLCTIDEPVSVEVLLERFRPESLPLSPWTWSARDDG